MAPALARPFKNAFAPVLGGGRSTQPGADGGECLTHHNTRHQMVQRKTQAPPPRLTPVLCYERPVCPFRFETFNFGSLAFAAAALDSFPLAIALLTLPFAAPFRGLTAFGSVIGATASEISAEWVGLGGTGNGSSRTCAGSSLVRATPSSQRPAPDGSVVTTPPGSPSSFQASAASSSSSLSSPSPAMIASAINPAF
jgi:hypothetical protein